MLLDSHPISGNSLEKHYYIDGDQFQQQYKDHLSDYHQWHQKEHAKDWLLFPKNLGYQLSIDETSLSSGDLYTIITNKAAKGKKGCLVAMIEGTKADNIIKILKKIPEKQRNIVKEVTLDMAGSMNKIVRRSFPKAMLVIDRFHVQKLAYDAVQEMRIKHRWDAIDKETNALQNAKEDGFKYKSPCFENGDTEKQLLARSRYLIFKSSEKWTTKQKLRAKILFREFPDIKKAYSLTHSLRMIFTKTTDKGVAYAKLAKWYKDVADSDFRSFNTIAATIYSHYQNILNYFENRSTNASAESFNAKLKAFRSSLRGVRDITFFLYRVAKLYA